MNFKRSRAIATFGLAAALAATSCPLPARATETSAELQERVNAAYAKLMDYTKEVELAGNQLGQVKQDLETVQGEIESTKEEVTQKEAELKTAQEELSGRLSSSYKTGDANLLSVILGSADFSELFSNIFYANKVADRTREAIDNVKAAKSELEQKQSELSEQESEQKQLVSDQEKRTAEVQAKASQQQSYYDGLDSQLQEQLADEAAAKAAAEAYQKQLEEAAKQQQQQQTANNTGANNNASSNTGNNGGNTGGNTGGNSGGGTGGNTGGNTGDSGNAPSSVASIAQTQVGKPYVYGASGPNSFDCSGLTAWAYAQVGYSLPHWSQGQYNLVASKGHLVSSQSQFKVGDLVFWGTPSSIYHVAIYIGGGQVVHAISPGYGVQVTSIAFSGTPLGGGSPV